MIFESWKKFAFFSATFLTMAGIVYQFRLAMQYDVVHPSMSVFSIWQLMTNSAHYLALYTFIFAVFEKITKERFVINQTNQQSRKLLSELIDACCAAVTVTPEGKITFFNDAFRSFMLDKLLYESLPSNIFTIFAESVSEKDQL